MPFKSEAQRRYLWAEHPSIASQWAHEYPGQKNLPKHVKKRRKAAAVLSAMLQPQAPNTEQPAAQPAPPPAPAQPQGWVGPPSQTLAQLQLLARQAGLPKAAATNVSLPVRQGSALSLFARQPVAPQAGAHQEKQGAESVAPQAGAQSVLDQPNPDTVAAGTQFAVTACRQVFCDKLASFLASRRPTQSAASTPNSGSAAQSVSAHSTPTPRPYETVIGTASAFFKRAAEPLGQLLQMQDAAQAQQRLQAPAPDPQLQRYSTLLQMQVNMGKPLNTDIGKAPQVLPPGGPPAYKPNYQLSPGWLNHPGRVLGTQGPGTASGLLKAGFIPAGADTLPKTEAPMPPQNPLPLGMQPQGQLGQAQQAMQGFLPQQAAQLPTATAAPTPGTAKPPPVGPGTTPSANPINTFGGISTTGNINGNAALGTPNNSLAKAAGMSEIFQQVANHPVTPFVAHPIAGAGVALGINELVRRLAEGYVGKKVDPREVRRGRYGAAGMGLGMGMYKAVAPYAAAALTKTSCGDEIAYKQNLAKGMTPADADRAAGEPLAVQRKAGPGRFFTRQELLNYKPEKKAAHANAELFHYMLAKELQQPVAMRAALERMKHAAPSQVVPERMPKNYREPMRVSAAGEGGFRPRQLPWTLQGDEAWPEARYLQTKRVDSILPPTPNPLLEAMGRSN